MISLKICNRIIEYSFYALFLLIPLAFTSATSELFELNKMWLTWGLTIIIGMAWLIKMVLQRKFLIQRTPLDIPIVLFLASQIISTIFSLDSHVSLWGYYSRFNGGLLSIISYILLYYAFLSNSPTFAKVQRLMTISLITGLIVALWGLPSHFGYDPTCYLFRGTLDVSCWTADFIPTIRIFSTLGQPDWLAAYLAILIPISITYFLKKRNSLIINHLSLILLMLFYVDLLFTGARSGFLAIWISLIFFAALYYWIRAKPKISISYEKFKSPVAILFFGFLIITFVIGTPFNQLNRFTLEGLGNYFQKTQAPKTSDSPTPQPVQPFEAGGTESADIRLNVWAGAINAWKNNPIIGSGVETFAFAYYKHKPASQNLTSEWNFLYNKAHNEYLNYLATTGLFGLGTYLLMIGWFLYRVIPNLFRDLKSSKPEMLKSPPRRDPAEAGQVQHDKNRLLILALLAAYISILITNFFGFSVVITNIYLFMIPAFVFVLAKSNLATAGMSNHESRTTKVPLYQWPFIVFIILASLFMILTLFRFWRADIAYALGYNLDRAGEYQQAYPALHKAVELRESELVFKDELSINAAIIAAALLAQEQPDDQKEQTISVSSSLIQEAINTSNKIVSKSPNNAVFWKTRTRLFHTLSQIDSRYLPRALDSIEKASILAPADANIWYNLGVIYGQNNNIEKGITALEKTVKLKPDYRDAYYGLGLFYHDQAVDEKGNVVNREKLEIAISKLEFILNNLGAEDKVAKDTLEQWKKL